ncbi:hypothetical protein DMI70_01790 [Escherichia coli]|nr:hypothetical protein [Escherichia coli]
MCYLKNFGVTRHGRVVFYDYDEICYMTEVNFRDIRCRATRRRTCQRTVVQRLAGRCFPGRVPSLVMCRPAYWSAI